MSVARSLVCAIVAASLIVGHCAPVALAASGETLTKAEYEACQTRDEASFRTAIETITHDSLKRSLSSFDYKNSVAESWRTTGMDDVVDKRVDAAIAEVSKQSTWGDLLQSLADQKKAQELAVKVAEQVYKSDEIKKGIEAIATDVGRTLGLSLEFASQDAAGPAISCVKAFLGTRYGAAVSGAVTGQAEKEFNIDGTKGKATVSGSAVLAQSSNGIAGAALILVRRQLANMASRVGARIAGSVLSRLVSVAAGGIGAVLLAKDVWDLRNGVLPIIATEMKSKPTKELIQVEIAKSISEQIGEHVKELAAKTSERVVEIWHEFRRAHMKSLDLAERSEPFKTFLNATNPSNLPRLDEIVGLVLGTEGEGALLTRLDNGTLNTAVNTAPAQAIEIARDTKSLEIGLKWATLAGDKLAKVTDLELHKRAAPDEFTHGSLEKMLALDDKLAITRLASIKPDARAPLFDLPSSDLKNLARALNETELATLSGYLSGLEAGPRERVLRAIAGTPARMKILASTRVRTAVLTSRNQASAVDMMLRASADTPADIAGDIKSAWEGDVSPILMWERHPAVTLMAIIPLLVAFLLLRRILIPRRRPKPHLPTAPPPTQAA